MENSIIARITDDGAVCVQLAKESGEVKRKTITLKAFIDILNKTKDTSDDKTMLGAMPNGYYDARIGSLEQATFDCILCIKAKRFLAHYYEESFVVPYPNLVFYFDVKKGNVIESKCFAVKEGELADETPLCHFPFANVYSDGKICWGGNSLPAVNTLKELDVLVQMFYGCPYNDDLYSEEYAKGYGGLFALFQGIKEKKSFPKRLLVETGKTVSDLFKKN